MNRRAFLSTTASAVVVSLLPSVEPMAETLSPFGPDTLDAAFFKMSSDWRPYMVNVPSPWLVCWDEENQKVVWTPIDDNDIYI